MERNRAGIWGFAPRTTLCGYAFLNVGESPSTKLSRVHHLSCFSPAALGIAMRKFYAQYNNRLKIEFLQDTTLSLPAMKIFV